MTPEQFQPLVVRIGLKAEIKGMRLTRGQSCLSICRQRYGLKAKTAAEMLVKLDALLTAHGYILT